MSTKRSPRWLGLAACIAAAALVGGPTAAADPLAPGWSALGAPYAPSEGIGEVAQSISCPTAATCAAVGYFEDTSDRQQALVMDGSGGDWTPGEVTLPAHASATQPMAALASVSCFSAGNCVAAGSYWDGDSVPNPMLVSETDGTWAPGSDAPALPADPNVGYLGPTMAKISCTAQVCAAVGQVDTTFAHVPSPIHTTEGYIVVGSGSSWTALLAPLPSGAAAKPEAELDDVSCAGDECEAVGNYTDTSGNVRGLIVRYSSGSWTASTAPLPANAMAGQRAKVDAIACPAAGECSAAGAYTDAASTRKPLLLSESSGTWSATEGDLPAGSARDARPVFNAIACSDPGDCAAVGFDVADNHPSESLPLAVAESGGTWQAAVNPAFPANGIALSTGMDQSTLLSVSCPTSSQCDAGGWYTAANESEPALITTFTAGAGWSPGMTAPLPTNANQGANQSARVFGLSCVSGSGCQGVGWYKGPFGQRDRALILGNGTPDVGVPQALRVTTLGPTARVPIICRGHTDCTVKMTLANSVTGKLILGTGEGAVTAAHSQIVPISLNAQGKKLLATHASIRVLLSVSERTLVVNAQRVRFHH